MSTYAALRTRFPCRTDVTVGWLATGAQPHLAPNFTEQTWLTKRTMLYYGTSIAAFRGPIAIFQSNTTASFGSNDHDSELRNSLAHRSSVLGTAKRARHSVWRSEFESTSHLCGLPQSAWDLRTVRGLRTGLRRSDRCGNRPIVQSIKGPQKRSPIGTLE